MLEILNTTQIWLDENRRVVLATVVSTWGSAPRRPGAKMTVNDEMGMAGSVSGGCVETAVIQEALDSLKNSKPRLLNYGVSDDTAWEVGLACGGKISVFVETLDKTWWHIISQRVHQNQPSKTATVLSGDSAGQKILMSENEILHSTAAPDLQTQLFEAAHQCNETSRVTIGELDVLIDVYRPTPRLIIVGGAHVAIALKNLAHLIGFRVIIVDPRKAFATAERFPDVEMISNLYPDKLFREIGLTDDSYVAILTHDPKIDDPALIAALPSPVPYIGVLSSQRTHEKRLERLSREGVAPELFTRIRTPIGLDIGAQSPEEIALCIMAEIVAVRNGAVQ